MAVWLFYQIDRRLGGIHLEPERTLSHLRQGFCRQSISVLLRGKGSRGVVHDFGSAGATCRSFLPARRRIHRGLFVVFSGTPLDAVCWSSFGSTILVRSANQRKSDRRGVLEF